MLFSEFAQYLSRLEQHSSRLEMTSILAELFQHLEEQEVRQASYLLLGGLTPQYDSLEFQLSTKMVIRSIARLQLECGAEQDSHSDPEQQSMFEKMVAQSAATQESEAILEVTRAFKKSGDVGTVAEQVRSSCSQETAALSIVAVYDRLHQVAVVSGVGSQEKKIDQVVKLLSELDAVSGKYTIRIIMGKMRLGFSTMTFLDALSWAVHADKSDSKTLEQTYQKKADIGVLAATYLFGEPNQRADRLSKYSVAVGVPVVPALCQRLNSAQEIIDKMQTVLAEPKYDGLRIQIHVKKGSDGFVKTYTRNLEETTHMFPELQTITTELHCDSCILDGEAIGYDPETGALQSFQTTITRKRKHEVATAAAAVPMRFYIFDILELDGKSLLDEKLQQRKDILSKLFEDSEVLKKAPYINTSDPEELRTFHVQALAEGLEGAVIKKADSVYQSGRKGWSWVKIKEAEGTKGKLSDTLDLVVLGYYAGRGKRASFGMGAFLAGVRTEEGRVVTLAKIGTGLSDEQFRELKNRSASLEVLEKPELYDVPKELTPDVWLEPGIVVEIAADEITNSPLHSAGVALRFPRLVRFRDDKNWQDSTTVAELAGITLA